MTTVAPPGRALCLRCGRSGDVVAESLDPRHPLVLCRWWEPASVAHGHGVTIGTRDQLESDAIQLRLRETRLQAVHVRGGHDARPNRLCPECRDGRGGRAQLTLGPS